MNWKRTRLVSTVNSVFIYLMSSDEDRKYLDSIFRIDSLRDSSDIVISITLSLVVTILNQ